MRYSQALYWSTPFLLATTGFCFSITPRRSTCALQIHVDIAGYRYNSFRIAQSLRALTDGSLDVDKEEDLVLQKHDPFEIVLVYLFPVWASLSAFTFYENISHGFHSFVQVASQNNWIPVDGGQLIGEIILPAINGPVLGTIGLLFATLVSMTIGNLYQRQISISSCLVREVDDLRRLGYLLKSLPQPYRGEAQIELEKFVSNMFEAATKRSFSGSTYRDITMTPIFLLLNRISEDCETDPSVKVSGNILGEGYELIRRINDQRTTIATLFRPAFPPLHYINLFVLGFCICLVFLIETDRDLVFFLAGFQLRLLFAILIGIFAMMAAVIYDLESPFRGSYNVSFLQHEQTK